MASQQVTGNVGMYYAYRLSRMGWNVPLVYELEDALPEETSQKSMIASRLRVQDREVVECSVLCHCVCG
jgi:hypothetical protein